MRVRRRKKNRYVSPAVYAIIIVSNYARRACIVDEKNVPMYFSWHESAKFAHGLFIYFFFVTKRERVFVFRTRGRARRACRRELRGIGAIVLKKKIPTISSAVVCRKNGAGPRAKPSAVEYSLYCPPLSRSKGRASPWAAAGKEAEALLISSVARARTHRRRRRRSRRR